MKRLKGPSRIGVAFGGGGARGYAHIAVMEVLDRLDIRPAVLSGTSIGAIIGAIYASGRRGEDIRRVVGEILVERGEGLRSVLKKTAEMFRWITTVSPYLKRGGVLNADRFLEQLLDEIDAETFEDLKIPLTVVATDYWTGEAVHLNSGPLLPAIKASMSIPGVFPPVELDGRVLVDGGMVDNVPWGILSDCDYTLAIDVSPTRDKGENPVPNMIDAVLGMFDLLIQNPVQERLDRSPPSLYVHPRIVGVRVLDFDKAESVIRQSEPKIAWMEEQLKERWETSG